jgi:acyl-coenzyme A thioesterase PaaI-like protein
MFSRILGWMIPYTSSLGAHVRELQAGYARVELRDRRRVRNHLHSVHAVALANLGELTSGLAMTVSLPPATRGIVTRLSTEYHKKARGLLVAESHSRAPAEVAGTLEQEVEAVIRDREGEEVARTVACWRLAPA